MKKLRSLKGHTYANKWQKPGDVYKASNEDAKLMVLLKNSEVYVPPVVVAPQIVDKPKRSYTRRNLEAGQAAGYSTKVVKPE